MSTLVLTQNNIAELADLDPLRGFAKLTHVSLGENPVASKEVCLSQTYMFPNLLDESDKNYRYYLLWRCPQIRFLDFQKVREAERDKAKELFGTCEAPTELAQGIIAVRSRHPTSVLAAPAVNGVGKGAKMKITEKERKRFEGLVKKAKTLSEVQRLEKAFAEGKLPAGVAEEDLMDET